MDPLEQIDVNPKEEQAARPRAVKSLERNPDHTAVAYTVREVAQMLRVSERTVSRAIASGKLRSIRVGRAVRVPRESLSILLSPPTAQGNDKDDTAGGDLGKRSNQT